MQSASYIKDSTDFQNKIKNMAFLKMWMTADVVGLYPNIPHKACLKLLKAALEKEREKDIYGGSCENDRICVKK